MFLIQMRAVTNITLISTLESTHDCYSINTKFKWCPRFIDSFFFFFWEVFESERGAKYKTKFIKSSSSHLSLVTFQRSFAGKYHVLIVHRNLNYTMYTYCVYMPCVSRFKKKAFEESSHMNLQQSLFNMQRPKNE